MRRRVRHAALAAVPAMLLAAEFLLLGCERSLGPSNSLRLVVDSVGLPGGVLDQTGQPIIRCPVQLSALNGSSSKLDWITSVLHYYPGGDTTIHGDSLILLPGAVAAIWGAGALMPHEGRSTSWLAGAPAPYFGVVEFRFQNDFSRTGFSVAGISFRCGVADVRARPGVGSPIISTVSVITAPWDPRFLFFNIAAVDTNGLWTMAFRDLSGCSLWGPTLSWPNVPTTFSSTDSSIGMFIPPDCGPGPFTITVTVRNALLHQTVDTLTASLP